MRSQDLERLTIGSTLGDVPGIAEAYPLTTRAGVVGQLFERRPELPGVLLLDDRGAAVSVLSRRYYLDAIGRFLGRDIYAPRPLPVLLQRFTQLGGALMLPRDTAIPEAVRRGLDRARELVYEPVVALGDGDAPSLLVDFEDLLLADSRITQLRNAQMRQVLATLQEGLLLVTPDRRIGAEYSRSVEALFATDRVAGRRLEALLAEVLDADRCALAADYLDRLFDPRVIESLVVKVNPLLRVAARAGGKAKVLEFRFARAVEGGRIGHVLVKVEDVSRREQLARELEAQRERADQRLELAMALTQTEPTAVGPFLAAVHRLVFELELLSAGGAPEQAAVDDGFRRAHRLKGEAGLLRLLPFESALHRLEDALTALRRSAGDGALSVALGELDGLRRDAAELIERFRSFGEGAGGDRRLAPGGGAPPVPATPTAELASELSRLVERAAADLGKRALLRAGFGPDEVPPHWRGLLRDVLVQLVRNAVAHGVEVPEERRRRGKPEVGTVQVALRSYPIEGWLEVVVQDDGRGLDRAAIERRAAELGVEAGERWRELLFRPGFSTAGSAHLHAGRGVGLDAVRDLVNGGGGRVELHSEPGRWCAVQVLLPLRVEVAV
jgi:signal transduction histidine kinase